MIRGTAGFRKRSRDQGPKDDMAQYPAGAEPAVERCALLPLGDGQALLHVVAHWAPDVPEGVALLSSGAGSPHPPVAPGPRVDDDGLWSASFAIAADAADGRLLLATPTEGPWPLPRPALAEPDAPQEEAQPDLETQAQADRLRRRCEVTERTLAEVNEKLVKAWSETAEMREILAAREAEHALAARRWATSDQILAELEARLEDSERELSEQRAALDGECERLQAELDRRRLEGARDAEELKAQVAEARAEAAEALANFEQARTDADLLRTRVSDARKLADETLTAAAAASRELTAERARAAEAAQLAEQHRQRLAQAEQELSDARSRISALDHAATEAQMRVQAAADENASLTAELEEARSAGATAATETEAAREHIAELEAARAEAETRADAAADEVAKLSAQLDEARAAAKASGTEAESAKERIAELEAAIAQADERAVAGAADNDALAAQLEEAKARIGELEAETTDDDSSSEQLAAAQSKLEAAEGRARAADARTNAASAEAVVLRERIDAAEHAAAEAAKTADELREERDRLTAKVGELSGSTVRDGIRRRSKVSARAHQEVLEKLEIERARAEATEAQLATTREELEEVRNQLEEQPEPEVERHTIDPDVEADLRHLLAMRQRELDDLRSALNEQRARYAAVASQLTPQELAESKEEPEERPWTAIDGDLLDRLTRAKQLTNED